MSYRQIGRELGISHVAAYKRDQWANAMTLRELFYQLRRIGEILETLNQWIRYYTPRPTRSVLYRRDQPNVRWVSYT